MKQLFYMICGLLLLACSTNPEEEKIETTESKKEVTPNSRDLTDHIQDSIEIPAGIAYYDDVARFISGLSPDVTSSEFTAFTENSAWRDYASQVDKSWKRFEERKLGAIGPWVQKEITDKQRYTTTAFYPFSGPDFTYLNAFLPDADTYYLFGLEPVGKIPDISELEVDSLDQLFAAMNDAIRDNLNLSFFITKKMKEEINNEQVTGTIPVLLFFMARSGKKIINIEAMQFNTEGKMEAIGPEPDGTKNFKNIVEITFVQQNTNEIKKLYYFSMNIADSGFKRNQKMAKFFDNLPDDMTTFVKSASYCMHDDKYAEIRNVVLTKSKTVIQDDSGVPLRFFTENEWNHFFFGKYTGPHKAFDQKLMMQDDLKEAFTKAQILPFRFGYSYPSNLFIAERLH